MGFTESGREVNIGAARWKDHNSLRRARIVQAAAELLDEVDIGDDVAMEQIATRAGVARSVVYRQFDGRSDLDRRVRTYIAEAAFETLSANLDVSVGSVGDIVTRSVRGILEWRMAHPRWYEFLGAGPTDFDAADVSAAQSLYRRFEQLVKLLLSGIAEQLGVDFAPFDALPYAAVAMVDGTLTTWLSSPAPARDKDDLIGDVATYVWYLLDGAARSVGLSPDPDATLIEVIRDATESARQATDGGGQ